MLPGFIFLISDRGWPGDCVPLNGFNPVTLGFSVDFKLDLPDALHFATALDLGCDAFLTNDKGFTDGEPFPIVYQLSQL